MRVRVVVAVYLPFGARRHAPRERGEADSSGAQRLLNDARQSAFCPVEAALPKVSRKSARILTRAESTANLTRTRAGQGSDSGASAFCAKKAHAWLTRQQAAAGCSCPCRRRSCRQESCRQAPPSAEAGADAGQYYTLSLASNAVRAGDTLRLPAARAARAHCDAADTHPHAHSAVCRVVAAVVAAASTGNAVAQSAVAASATAGGRRRDPL